MMASSSARGPSDGGAAAGPSSSAEATAGPSGTSSKKSLSQWTRADMEQSVEAAAATASAAAQSAAEAMVRGLANGVSYIALEEWTMQGAIESAIDMLRDRMDPQMTDLDQAIPQWVFQRAKVQKPTGPCFLPCFLAALTLCKTTRCVSVPAPSCAHCSARPGRRVHVGLQGTWWDTGEADGNRKQQGEQFTAPRARNDTRVLTPTCRASQVGMFASVSAGSGVVVRVSRPQAKFMHSLTAPTAPRPCSQLAKFKGLDGRTRWSAPSAFAFGGGGGGFDFGGARSDVLLVLNSDESVSMFTGTACKLSMAVQAALGPLGRHAEGGVHLDPQNTELQTNYSYGSSAGLFVGVGLQGLVVVPRDKENQEYYRASEITSGDLLAGAAGLDVLGRHEEVVRLHRMLDKACGGNGRPEKYDTPEMRGTPF